MKGNLSKCIIVFLILITAYSVLALHCFHCASNVLSSPCETDVKELKEGVFSDYAKNCSDYNIANPVCAIEIHKEKDAGATQRIFRTCSNGKDFTFDMQLPHFKKFSQLNAKSNVTICTHYQHFICVSICDKDMCNGPLGAIVDFNRTSSCGKVAFSTMPLIIGTGITFANMNP